MQEHNLLEQGFIFIFDTAKNFLSFDLDFGGGVSFSLWQLLLGVLAFSIIVYFVQRILD